MMRDAVQFGRAGGVPKARVAADVDSWLPLRLGSRQPSRRGAHCMRMTVLRRRVAFARCYGGGMRMQRPFRSSGRRVCSCPSPCRRFAGDLQEMGAHASGTRWRAGGVRDGGVDDAGTDAGRVVDVSSCAACERCWLQPSCIQPTAVTGVAHCGVRGLTAGSIDDRGQGLALWVEAPRECSARSHAHEPCRAARCNAMHLVTRIREYER